MSTALTELHKYTDIEMKGCPQPFIMQNIIKVLREFFDDTLRYTVDLDPINIQDGITDYDVDGQPSQTEIIVPTTVIANEITLNPVFDYTMPSKKVIHLVSEPTEDILGGLLIEVAVRPKLDATHICSEMFSDYVYCWAAGVKSKLMLMAGETWSNELKGRQYSQEYWNGVAKAKIEINREFMAGTLQARAMYPFA